MYDMNMNNKLVDIEIFSLCCKKNSHFKWSFNCVSGNHGPLLSQINQTYFRGFCPGFFLCLRTPLGKEVLYSHSCIQSLHMRELRSLLIVNSLYMPLVFASLTFKKGVIEVFLPNPARPT